MLRKKTLIAATAITLLAHIGTTACSGDGDPAPDPDPNPDQGCGDADPGPTVGVYVTLSSTQEDCDLNVTLERESGDEVAFSCRENGYRECLCALTDFDIMQLDDGDVVVIRHEGTVLESIEGPFPLREGLAACYGPHTDIAFDFNDHLKMGGSNMGGSSMGGLNMGGSSSSE